MPEIAVRATKRRALVDARVEAEFTLSWVDRHIYGHAGVWRERTPEELAQLLEQRCLEFEEFIRDHRSQDPVRLTVQRQYQEQCSACHQAWDPDTSGRVPTCGYCGAELADAED